MINPVWVAFGTGMFLGVWFGIAIWAFVVIRDYQRPRAILKRLNAIIVKGEQPGLPLNLKT